MGNPIDDYLESCPKEKTAAGFGTALAGGVADAFTPRRMGTLAAQTGIVAGASMLIGAAKKMYDAATKTTDFRSMMDVNPDLSQYQGNDPRMFNQHYNSLRRLNPTFASDPVVAGSYMRQMSEFPGNAGQILVNSMGAAPRLPQSKLKDYGSALNIVDRMADPDADRPPRNGSGQGTQPPYGSEEE